jgi:uncharacterized protein YoxC
MPKEWQNCAMSKFGSRWWSGWLPATKLDLERLGRKIMQTQVEVIAQLKQVSQDLKDTNLAIGSLQTEVGKVGTETEALQQTIKDLQVLVAAGGAITPELIDAVNDVAAQAGTVKAGVATVAAGVQAVDDKVPDLVVPPPTP